MQSHQETVLEHLMAHSFGASEIYVPIKIKKGKGGHREPTDLAWVNTNTAILFYMNRSVQAFERQADHNIRQANGYLRLWATKKPSYALSGTNRFGTVGYFPWASIRNILLISVVSGEIGYSRHDTRGYSATYPEKRVLCLSMNEKAIERLASFNASIVDFVSLIEQYSDAHMLSVEALENQVNLYVENGHQKLTSYLGPAGQHSDALAVTHYLSILKPASLKGITLHGPLRQFFSDLSLRDRSSVVATALQAIKTAGPPHFKEMAAIYTPLCWHSVICAAASVSDKRFDGYLKEWLEKRSDPRHRETALIWWGHTLPGVDYRQPMVFFDPTARAEYSQLNYVVDCLFDPHHRTNNPKSYNSASAL
jgi:hypothetical protein